MKDITREWLKKADADYDAARLPGLSIDLVCFHCQQALEKYLKGYLYEHGIRFPKTHELDVLLDLSLDLQPLWESWRSSLQQLSRYAAEFRYPGEWASEGDAVVAVRTASAFRREVLSSLGVQE